MRPNIARLIAGVLDEQVEDNDDFDDLDFAIRVRNALRLSMVLPGDLAALVWSSPLARSIYLRLRIDATVRAQRQWVQRGFATELVRLAADSDEDSEAIAASGVIVRTTRSKATGGWIITLRLAVDAFEELPTRLSVRLSDKGGMTWLEGQLDSYGGLDGLWQDATITPRERLRSHGLTIEFF